MQIPVRFGVLAASAAGMLGCATEAAPPSSSTAAAPQTCKLHADCASGWCKDGVCGPKASCTDGVQNATETGVDCGGPCAACPPPPPRCDDAIQNGKETDLDCGGTCGPCAVGKSCSGNADCASALCVSTVCRAPGWALGAGVDGFGGYTVVATLKMATPSALAFNPAAPDELWVANRKDGSLTIVSLTNGTAVRYVDKALHFLEAVVALSFSNNGTFGTCGDTRNDYHGNKAPNDFMGPVLWPASADDFASMGTFSASDVHLDMMHDTPYCMGIAALDGNRYAVFNGLKGTVDAYDFGTPHPNGTDNHTDGAKVRYAGLGLKRVANVPSHMVYDKASGLLFVADTGNGRIVQIDLQSGSKSSSIKRWVDEVKMTVESNLSFDTVANGLAQPSGLLLHGGYLYVTEAASGKILALGLDGKVVRQVDTGLGAGALAGIAAGPDELLYFVDRKGNRVLRVLP